MNLFENNLYKEDIRGIASLDLPWGQLHQKTVLISGSTGLFGTMLVDVLMLKNKADSLDCHIVGLGRNFERGAAHFDRYMDDSLFNFYECDLNAALDTSNLPEKVDFIVHLASNTDPKSYATDPIGTIATNVFGTNSLLSYGADHGCQKFVFASTCEIYGENKGDVELFDEKYCGYIDCNSLRAGYNESKRCGETLCQAFIAAKGMDIVIPRFARSYGPTLRKDDSKALSQFLSNALDKKDIVLKSNGEQYFSYIYAADAVSGLLTVMLKGKCGEAYNIADESSNIHLKDLAELIANLAGVKVVFDLPDAVEAAGFSKATKALLDNSKIVNELGWKALYDINAGISRTLEILANQ